jgi:ubiquinol-cytochrome c reductase cytochrome b subunit
VRGLLRWIDEQTGLVTLIGDFMREPLAEKVGWPHVFGSLVMFLFVVQACSGVLLMVYYVPSPDTAYESVSFISRDVPFGHLVRGLHHWGASFMIVLLAVHMLQVFFWGAYKRPRQIVWVVGVFLLLVTFGLSFTGYLLPWDQKAYWATVVGTRIAGSAPIVGPYITALIRGGGTVGALALTRFFALHVLIFPALLVGLMVFHMAHVRIKGITPPWRRVGEEEGVRRPQLFYPDQVFRDLVAAALLLALLLVVAWRHPAPLEAKADPTATGYVPRPEWYFLPNFELLKHLPTSWGEWGEFIGAAVMPAIGVLALLALPYFDRNPERHPRHRPLAVFAVFAVLGTMTYLGLAGVASTPREVRLTSQQARGEKIFLDRRCNACHGINGGGGIEGQDLAPDGPRDPERVATILRKPTTYNPRSIMPPVTGLSTHDFEALVAFVSSIDKRYQMPREAVAAGSRRPQSHQEENWFANHKYEVRKDPTVCGQCHAQTFCQSCHLKRRPDSHLAKGWLKSHFGTATERPEYCQVCHQQKFCDSCHTRIMHTKDWMHRHPQAAKTDSKICQQCHKPDFCITCHGGAKPASHDQNWLHEHPKSASKDCVACHTEDFCSSCHQGAKPASHTEQWLGKHGAQAKTHTAACTTCHTTHFCQDCHGATMPHPKQWRERGHQPAAKASPQTCARCHDTKRFCTACHGLDMPHPEGWVLTHKEKASFKPEAVCFRCHTYQNKCAGCHGDTPPE